MNGSIEKGLVEIQYSPRIEKFSTDNFVFEDDQFKIVCEGMIVNSADLLNKYHCAGLQDVIRSIMTESDFASLLQAFCGNYVICCYDKAVGKLYLGNDLLSKRPVYYYGGSTFLFDSSFFGLTETAKRLGLPLDISQRGAMEMLRLHSFLLDHTYVTQIRFLEPYQYIVADLQSGDTRIVDIPIVLPQNMGKDEDAAVEKLNSIFSEYCRKMLTKSTHAGFRTCFSISGGMDSRAVLYQTIPWMEKSSRMPLCFSYGAANCMDLRIASRIAEEKGCDLHIQELSDGSFLLDREELLSRNEGQMYYCGTTGLLGAIKALNTQEIGVVFSGLGGGEIMGDIDVDVPDRTAETEMFHQLFGKVCTSQAEIQELTEHAMEKYHSYNTFFHFMDLRVNNNFRLTAGADFEVFSPFLQEDFFIQTLSIPLKWKKERKFYLKWFSGYMRSDIPTISGIGKIRKIKYPWMVTLRDYAIAAHKRLFGIRSKWNMNPLKEWMDASPELQEKLSSMFLGDIDAIKAKEPQMSAFCRREFDDSDALQKLYVLTLSGVLRRIIR